MKEGAKTIRLQNQCPRGPEGLFAELDSRANIYFDFTEQSGMRPDLSPTRDRTCHLSITIGPLCSSSGSTQGIVLIHRLDRHQPRRPGPGQDHAGKLDLLTDLEPQRQSFLRHLRRNCIVGLYNEIGAKGLGRPALHGMPNALVKNPHRRDCADRNAECERNNRQTACTPVTTYTAQGHDNTSHDSSRPPAPKVRMRSQRAASVLSWVTSNRALPY